MSSGCGSGSGRSGEDTCKVLVILMISHIYLLLSRLLYATFYENMIIHFSLLTYPTVDLLMSGEWTLWIWSDSWFASQSKSETENAAKTNRLMMHCRLLCGPGLTREVRNDYNMIIMHPQSRHHISLLWNQLPTHYPSAAHQMISSELISR